jgi:hypothetical protein
MTTTNETSPSTPSALAVLASPVLGLAFLITLPFVGFALALRALLAAAARLVRAAAAGLAATLSTGWQLGEAHLTGQASDQAHPVDAGSDADDALAALEHEIAWRRQHP